MTLIVDTPPLVDTMSDADGVLPAAIASRITVNASTHCWVWSGSLTKGGYGHLRWGGGWDYSHRVAYRALKGAIPAGLVIDHLCRNRACCNPAHLEAVEHLTNVRRGQVATKTRCVHGHEYTPDNTYRTPRGHRRCRTCAGRFQRMRRSA